MSRKLNDSCAPTNAVQDLARTYGKSNEALRSGVERQIDHLAPSGSKSDRYAEEFLAQVGRQTVGPRSVNVRQILGQPAQSAKWAEDFAKHQAALGRPADQWANDFRVQHPFNMAQMTNELPSAWADEFQQQHAGALAQPPAVMHEKWSEEFDNWIATGAQSSNFDEAWKQAAQPEGLSEEWAKEFAEKFGNQEVPNIDQATLDAEFDKIFHQGMEEWSGVEELGDQLAMEYEYAEENPHLNGTGDLMQEAQAQIRAGNTQEAILLLEAHVRQNPQNAEAWCQLGFCHAENEHDIAAISSFKKALEIDPNMREALLGYSVSLANENYNNEALSQLEKWLDAYSNRVAVPNENDKPRMGFFGAFIDPNRFQAVEKRFLDAARQQTNSDPELQNALGVLYNLNGTFDRAVDSIKTAIARKPDDPRLWNRLGATLANSDRTAEAIEAYRHALQLFPAYVRARYNLGISCMHLNCYPEAADHFLSALDLQKHPDQSPIWSTLRSALIRMEKTNPAVMDALNRHDAGAVRQALNVS